MTKTKRATQSSRNDWEIGAFGDLVHAVCVFLLLSGRSPAALNDALRLALKRASKDQEKSNAATSVHVSLARILHAWHNEKPYLSSDARPRPIPLTGRGASLESLTKEYGQPLDVDNVRALLAKHRLVRTHARGYLVPTGSVVRFRTRSAELSGYLGRSILHLMSTMQSNLYGGARTAKLVERAALVKDLPAKDVEAFCRYSAEQGESFSENMNSWLESRNGKAERGTLSKTVTAGVHVFAFVERNGKSHRRKRSAKP
jgi:hypothetical protein